MLQKIRVKNFKSINDMDLYFEKNTNIIWNNWAWKTNILQAICYLFQYNVTKENIENLVKIWEKNIYIEWYFINNSIEYKLTFSYDLDSNKKSISLNNKKVTKKILVENILKISYFSPISMNMFYLWPKYRREFLDDILTSIFSEYWILLKEYEKIVKNRNKTLQNIYLWNSKNEEINIWNKYFVENSCKIYKYRIELNNFILENLWNFNDIFWNNFIKLEYKYLTKVDLDNIESSINDYLEKNFQRDIILWKTHIWPHIDDFDILINDKNIVNFASRGEIKSVIICLKLIEINFIKRHTWKSPIILIDDLSSELDEKHSNLMLEKLSNLQIIFTSITAKQSENIRVINI